MHECPQYPCTTRGCDTRVLEAWTCLGEAPSALEFCGHKLIDSELLFDMDLNWVRYIDSMSFIFKNETVLNSLGHCCMLHIFLLVLEKLLTHLKH